ncbi:MAG: DUF6788 family protein [Bryobacteraceae bacterium]
MHGPYAQPRGFQAARLRQRKAQLLARFAIPQDLLPGSLAQSHLRCGKPTCHCAQPNDLGHPVWTLTFMVRGKKHTRHIPKEWLVEVQRRVRAGRRFLDAVREVLAINAQLVVLARRQRRQLP